MYEMHFIIAAHLVPSSDQEGLLSIVPGIGEGAVPKYRLNVSVLSVTMSPTSVHRDSYTAVQINIAQVRHLPSAILAQCP